MFQDHSLKESVAQVWALCKTGKICSFERSSQVPSASSNSDLAFSLPTAEAHTRLSAGLSHSWLWGLRLLDLWPGLIPQSTTSSSHGEGRNDDIWAGNRTFLSREGNTNRLPRSAHQLFLVWPGNKRNRRPRTYYLADPMQGAWAGPSHSLGAAACPLCALLIYGISDPAPALQGSLGGRAGSEPLQAHVRTHPFGFCALLSNGIPPQLTLVPHHAPHPFLPAQLRPHGPDPSGLAPGAHQAASAPLRKGSKSLIKPATLTEPMKYSQAPRYPLPEGSRRF